MFHAPVDALDGSGQAAFEQLRLIDAADGQEKTLLEMVGAQAGTTVTRTDLRFGIDDAGRIHLVTKRDGAVRRIVVPLVLAPALAPLGWGVLALVLAAAAIPFVAHRRVRSAGGRA
jgi:hypothetical protein